MSEEQREKSGKSEDEEQELHHKTDEPSLREMSDYHAPISFKKLKQIIIVMLAGILIVWGLNYLGYLF